MQWIPASLGATMLAGVLLPFGTDVFRALLGTIGNSLQAALHDPLEREAAVVTFLVAASGLSLAGIGAAFWTLVAGLLVRVMLVGGRH